MAEQDNQWNSGIWAAADLATPMAIRVAATLRLADHIHAGRRTAAELAPTVDADEDALGRLLRHLVTARVLTRDADGGYALTELGSQLREEHPSSVTAWIDLEGAVGRADLSFAQLLHTVRTGRPAYPEQFGRTFWADLDADPALGASFDALMSAHSHGVDPAAATTYDWAALGHVVDVGGGDGTLLITLLRAHPGLRGTVLDLPGPAKTAAAKLTEAGLGERAGAVPGSFFDPLPAGAGGYLLSSVTHDWDDASVTALLANCAAAARPGGKVLVVEGLSSNPDEPDSTEMDLRMLAYCAGRERSRTELHEVARAAGLRATGTERALGDRTLVEFVPEP